ncbi:MULTISPECIES: M81 family metallopeptidase [unclassified Chelatococcus]|jgi:microcystin degradation protein MlrC|uniref:M81 family metallopeptidase n=1 Tax=unclassified Chelatococcus TaxID=2638111 RepID=UPI001BD008AA|nr:MULTISPECIES: M81 family metallopeptidase [unclassified Chelatococcus]CAH1649682.1 Microcystinase C [Hyphomicrobiales bacterium]MBS7739634.1 M81 family metallopeptidase [Chelatococcus sp. HY11]MBX3544003.1 M81 family metallopeptidase [Chelatococcus sp.]MCO5075829.1 M81 family metallopeptidase [Chelatococcus sp.]CAH1667056.1 Microcystinase C [Hyphomicrobiales bacterium]
MKRILVADCKQEISSFNPLPSGYENFHIRRGDALYEQRGTNQELGGAFAVFEARPDIEIVPSIGARSGSAGILSASGWKRLSQEVLDAIFAKLDGIDGIYFSLHGAMGAEGELDPEGHLLEKLRERVGPDMPIVISLDLHGILTDRMLRQVNGFTIYWTYPHVDFADTGRRAAELLLKIMDNDLKPVAARVVMPTLVRGDELITKSGCYGDLLRDCRRLEEEGKALAAGIMIGNPFTDVPELCSQVLILTDGDAATAEREAVRLSEEFWPQRFRMQGKLISLERAIAQAKAMPGPLIFTDAADATSSGASGDSNAIIAALSAAGYGKKVLAPIVDEKAAAAAHAAGVGATIEVTLGGTIDPGRFTPMPVKARVKLLSDGEAQLETMKAPLSAGPTAVLTFGNFTVVVMSRSVSLFDRAMYYANGLDPLDFDLIVVKSPHTEYHMFEEWCEHNFNIDAPGATSANLKSLGHTICARPMYPMEPDVTFSPKPVIYNLKGQST